MWFSNCTWEYIRSGEDQGGYAGMHKMYPMVEEGALGGAGGGKEALNWGNVQGCYRPEKVHWVPSFLFLLSFFHFSDFPFSSLPILY